MVPGQDREHVVEQIRESVRSRRRPGARRRRRDELFEIHVGLDLVKDRLEGLLAQRALQLHLDEAAKDRTFLNTSTGQIPHTYARGQMGEEKLKAAN
jgi:hypothetical protein